MGRRRRARIEILAALVLVTGCAAGDECRFGAECPSGVCSAEGTCVPADAGAIEDASALPDAGPDLDAGSVVDAGAPDTGADAGPAACHDGDGRLTADELPLPLDVAISFQVATAVTIDTHGTERADGTRLWGFEGPYAGDVDRTFVRTSPAGAWFAASYPSATYVLPLSAEDELLGVFALSTDTLTLLGIVSPEGGLTRTELTYDPPAVVWRFPLEVSATWSSTSTVNGVAGGLFSGYTERWVVTVDAAGDAGTPAGVREVLRVNTAITRTAGLITEIRRHSYVEPCVGTVVQVFGTGVGAEPTSASEIWRIAP